MLDNAEPEALRQYLERLELNLQAVRRRLKRYEDEHGLTTAEFYARLQGGEFKTGLEYAEWAGEHEMAQRLEQQREELKKKLDGPAAP
jgi:predicted  nucleic acid-binding Zn-ribbon protein